MVVEAFCNLPMNYVKLATYSSIWMAVFCVGGGGGDLFTAHNKPAKCNVANSVWHIQARETRHE